MRPGICFGNRRPNALLDFEAAALDNDDVAQVVLDHLTKVFGGPNGGGVRAVDDISISVAEKELLVLVGPSGCGKTTTLRLIAGLESPTSGGISIGGEVVNDIPPKDRAVAMVFQSPALYPHLSVYENLAFGLKLRRVPRLEIHRRVTDAATTLGLAECMQRLPMALSGGQRQCVALGRALVRRPKVLLCDEPLSHLDVPTRTQLRAEIRRVQAALGATLIYVTHDQVEAMALGHRIAVMRAGVIQQVASPATIYQRPANLFVAGFMGSPPMNFLTGSIRASSGGLEFVASDAKTPASVASIRLATDPGMFDRLKPRVDEPVVLGVRPEHLGDARQLSANRPVPTFMARAEAIEPLGAEIVARVTAGGYALGLRLPAGSSVRLEEALLVSVDMTQAHFFDPASGKNLCVS